MTGLDGLHDRVAVVGAGIAGMMTALALAPVPVVLISRAGLGQDSASQWAQGGLAASLGPEDSPAQHLADTLAAGAGLCDVGVARGVLAEAAEAVAALEAQGLRFDRDATGAFALGLEGAHGRRRILHVGGDGTGAAITAALCKAVRRCPSIHRVTGVTARRLLRRDGQVTGLLLQRGREGEVLATGRVVLATGGLGGLYAATTNPAGSRGQGLALAARAGARLADMEFVQFHPTALATGTHPLPLVSEAVRGEGAVLTDAGGAPLMQAIPGGDLAPRDVVARALHAEIAGGGRAYLNARAAPGAGFAARFPRIARACLAAGIDPARQPIPVCPAAHYHMGGIETDARGRSSLAGLWAVGECAATGLHGANRLASNSLTEAVVMARRAARDIAGAALPRPRAQPAPPMAAPTEGARATRAIVSRDLGVLRDAAGLARAVAALLPLTEGEEAEAATVALAIATFAALRVETRGAHARSDHPATGPNARRQSMTWPEIRAAARLLLPQPARSTP